MALLANTYVTTDSSGMELMEYMKEDFPIACCEDNLDHDEAPSHWHEELEADMVTEGTIVFPAGGRRFVLQKGDAIFINSGVLHGASRYGNHLHYRAHSTVFHAHLITPSENSLIWQKYLNPLMQNPHLAVAVLRGSSEDEWESRAIAALEASWRLCRDEPPLYEMSMQRKISEFLEELIGNAELLSRKRKDDIVGAETRHYDQRIRTMILYVRRHYADNITLSDIAASASVSESECLRSFHSGTGQTPIRFLRQYRLHRAAELLRSTDIPLALIPENCGFNSAGYFSRSFRSEYGITPTEYRKQRSEHSSS